jgi:hypothetical protein
LSLSYFLEGDLDGFLDYLSADFLDLVSSPLSFLDLVSLGGLSALSLDLDLAFF